MARAVGGEIVVADPFQRYRGLEIAADAPRPRQRAEVRYHLVGDLDPTEGSTAGEFAARARAAIDDILRRGRVPVVSGGTGLYLQAALTEMEFSPPASPEARRDAEELVAGDPSAALARLTALDPRAAARVDARNPRRLVRALELAESGAPSAGASGGLWSASPRHPSRVVGIARTREVLHRRIAERVRRELDEGLVSEIAALLDQPGAVSREAAQIIGVREVQAMRCGELPADRLEEALIVRTRQLARKQMTWLRKMPEIAWIDLGEDDPPHALDAALARLRETC